MLGSADVRIAACRFVENSAQSGGGGAVMCTGSALHVDDCVFERNSTTLWFGGAVDLFHESTAAITRSTFAGNRAGKDAGALNVSYSSTADVNNCTFWGNTAATEGGREVSGRSRAQQPRQSLQQHRVGQRT